MAIIDAELYFALFPVLCRYPGERIAQLTCSVGVELPKEAMVVGTKGTIKILTPFWCPTTLILPDVRDYVSVHGGKSRQHVYIVVITKGLVRTMLSKKVGTQFMAVFENFYLVVHDYTNAG